jgi:hypothetical protein
MKKDNIFKIVFCILMLTYLTLYFAGVSGYYEYKNYKKMVLTEEQINKFEEDVKEGKEINVEDYIIEENSNHNNKIANTGKRLSFTISSSMSKVLTKCFKVISKFITE